MNTQQIWHALQAVRAAVCSLFVYSCIHNTYKSFARQRIAVVNGCMNLNLVVWMSPSDPIQETPFGTWRVLFESVTSSELAGCCLISCEPVMKQTRVPA